MSRICILPARGGSKRIPRKNIRPFRGRPMIHWAIDAARVSGCFDRILVSTDDNEIADVATSGGAEVPFRRSSATSDDHATTVAVLLEVLDVLAARGEAPDLACCLYATAPLASPDDLRGGLARILDDGWDTVLSVTRFDYPIWRSLRMEDDTRVDFNWPEHRRARSQDLPIAWHDAGQWYWFRPGPLRESGRLIGPRTAGFALDPRRVQDIDDEDDWALAELKHRAFVDRATGD